jgi:mannose-1-phosphate guanylyltransferase
MTSACRRGDLRLAIIMSGGRGRRFWPLSRAGRAKQLIKLFDGKTLLELTAERLIPVFKPEEILVVTQKSQYDPALTGTLRWYKALDGACRKEHCCLHCLCCHVC